MRSWARSSVGTWLGALLAGLVGLATPALGAGPAVPATANDASPDSRARFAAFLRDLKADAEARGISPGTFAAAFAGISSPDPDILARTRKQGEFARPVWDYLVGAVSAGRIARGRAEAARLSSTLASIEGRYGVPRWILLAFWGVESDFGASGGTVPTIRALATLAEAGFRGPLFRNELLDALTILQRGDTTPERMKGSWAGAMGQVQFLPSSFLAHAVDFDGDGHRDIWTSQADALASIASYLKNSGWNSSLSWGYEVVLPAGFDLAGYRGDLSDFARRGVRRTDGKALPGAGTASLFLPGGSGGPIFLITVNFDVIRAYNTSDSYALAVGHLSDRLGGGPALAVPWPMGSSRLDKAGLQALQSALAARGFYAGDADGRAGPKLREAIRRFQIAEGIPADGYAAPDLLKRLKSRP